MHKFKMIGLLGVCSFVLGALLLTGLNISPDTGDETRNSESANVLSLDEKENEYTDATTSINTTSNMTNPIATFTTNLGVFEVELYEDVMPKTAGNFRTLAEDGYFDGTKFHRIVEGFMIQGGDPLTKDDDKQMYWGTGGPGYSIPDEFVSDERLVNVRGTLSMANAGPNTGGSQFFVNTGDNTFLDGRHPVFGQVVSGMDVITTISGVAVEMQPGGGEQSRPVEPVVIESVTIRTEE